MNQQEVLEILRKTGAVITDSHIVYTSGKHGTAYVNKDAIYPHTKQTSELCRAIAEEFCRYRIEAVVAPAVGAIILSQGVAYHLSELTGREVLGVYADKVQNFDGEFVIKRGYDKLIAGKFVLVVEDIITTGGSVKRVIAEVRRVSGSIVGVAALCNRGGVTARDLGVQDLFSLANVKLDAWDEAECKLCAQGIPVNTDVGKGREFLARERFKRIVL